MRPLKSFAFLCLFSAFTAIMSSQVSGQTNQTATESPYASSSALRVESIRPDKTIWEKASTAEEKTTPLPPVTNLSSVWMDDRKEPTTENKKNKITLPARPAKPQTPPIKWDWKSTVMVGLLQGSTIFDMETTFRTLERCPGCKEGNPILRPFVKSGRPGTYAFTTGMNMLSTYGALSARAQGKKWWYWPIVANVAVHVVAGVHNSRIKSTMLQPVASNLQ